jgi:hypothetical protein
MKGNFYHCAAGQTPVLSACTVVLSVQTERQGRLVETEALSMVELLS